MKKLIFLVVVVALVLAACADDTPKGFNVNVTNNCPFEIRIGVNKSSSRSSYNTSIPRYGSRTINVENGFWYVWLTSNDGNAPYAARGEFGVDMEVYDNTTWGITWNGSGYVLSFSYGSRMGMPLSETPVYQE
ncbi:MAG: hypothetical protein LBH42_02375 [Treponema sp.]|jgi:hypothetical protein|nr:hypothetical protein [Treponema sp.]